jgi:predicted enzyme related to lactoylglutathione lyase
VPNPDEACEFYKQQFELNTVERDHEGNIRLTDGIVALMFTKSQIRPKIGVQFFGIQVADVAGSKRRLEEGGVAVSEPTPGQIQFNDPEGNRVVVSESGWVN